MDENYSPLDQAKSPGPLPGRKIMFNNFTYCTEGG